MVKDFRAGGDRLLWFGGDGQYGTSDEKFTLTTVGAVNGMTMNTVFAIDSARVGTYGVVDDFVWVAETETLFEEYTMKVGDQISLSNSGGDTSDIDLFGYTGQVPNMAEREAMEGVAIFRCAGDTLELESDGGIVSTFTRAK